ncbi:LacI family DNA-binding transcriptional regulator [Spongiactinospora sp. TRM90649]|uniref:LacI family DNA-binding transcriptional regulator n=1 Tax=Spongiactinospora sp. TRM90649 TaxID=3031114 RepID=UPI0023F78683|nr:LacI family DNA-binding transcriptional regulator [Spongiactinospora sp. TRM90649]MDF5752130.1 LacI family DNA-binding transcriptional regulator [Spongiactinospora sp. TRM90649]
MAGAKLADVALEAGVHVGTVSRALNPATRSRVNAETAARIIEVAQRLGYEVNITGRALRTQRTQTVGALIPDLTNPLFPRIVRGVEDSLEKAGYTALITNTDNDAQRERRMIAALTSRQVDGFLIASARLDDQALKEITEEGVPVVVINRTSADARASAVIADDSQGIADVMAHLVALGHERIAHLAGPGDTSTGQARLKAFEAALDRYGLQHRSELVVRAEAYTIAAGTRCLRELLKRGNPFTAVVAGNDLLALGALDALKENRIPCPERVSVVGFNDIDFAERLSPALTTVRVPKYELGARGAELLLDMIYSGREISTVTLPVTLMIRDSTAPPPLPGTGLFGL